MPILCAVVAYQKVILAEERVTPQLRPLITKIMEKIPRHDNKVSYQYEANVYHCLVENEILYLCMSDANYQARTVYGFLGDVRDKFKAAFAGSEKKYPPTTQLTPAACGRFSSTLGQQMRYFNDNPEGDKMGRIREQIEGVKTLMLENIDSVLERGERIDNLCERTEALKEEAAGFHDNSRSLKRKMQWRNIKLLLAIIFLVLLLGLIISMVVCGINYKKCKSDDTNTNNPNPNPNPTPAPTQPTPQPTAPTATPNVTLNATFQGQLWVPPTDAPNIPPEVGVG